MPASTQTVWPFLMFQGEAGAALRLYKSLFADAEILDVALYGAGESGTEGEIKRARFRFGGQTVLCFDSPVKHQFAFTPSFSFFVECVSELEIDRFIAALSDGGQVLMEPANYGFSRKFAWLTDRFGISWQLNLTAS